MTGASKILTVSYGTFSCTLEGFEDPFNTMKAIAEYFRDLAAEDRYFGAEPPTPDAAMLHRIAEREIQRRVEAKIQENGVVLRAAEGAGADTSLPHPTITFPNSAETVAAPVVTPTLAPAVQPMLSDAPKLADAEPQAESVAEKLSRLRAEAARDADAQAATVQAVTAQTVTVAPAAAAMPVTAPAEPAQPDTTTDALLAGLMADLTPVAAATGDAPVADDVSYADAATDAATDALDLSSLTEETETTTQSFEDSLSAALDFPIADAIEETEAEPAAESIFAIDDDQLEADPIAEAPPLPAAFADEDQDVDLSFLDGIAPAAGSDDLTAAPAPVVAEPAEAAPEPVAIVEPEAAPMAEPQLDAQTEAQPDVRPDAAEKLQRARARVIRIRRAEPEATAPVTNTAMAAQVAPAAPAAPIAAAPVAAPLAEAAMLSPEAEADLEAELAALQADALPQAPELTAALNAPAAEDADEAEIAFNAFAPDEADEAPRKAFADQGADDAVSRLMAQADEVMEGPENKRRLSAIAHLKAAVAATVAERKVSGEQPAPEASRLARYRDDLALVVRSKLGVGPAIDPNAPRPAPLVLVSEQRIDKPQIAAQIAPQPAPQIAAVPDQPRPVVPAAVAPVEAPAPAPVAAADMPVRPRRVIASETTIEDDSDEIEPADTALIDVRGFTEFAERLGAKTLPQLIEASAAYLAVVQKREAFSRPQLMANVEAALPGELPREDGLRSFGALLRTGRLTKLRRGQFVLADSSTYLDEGKRIAG